MEKNEKVIAPQLFIAEMNSAMSKHIKAGEYTIDMAHAMLREAHNLVDEFFDMQENYIEALDEGIRQDHSSYDMFYLTLTRRNGATLFTLDRRLIALCEHLEINCIHAMFVTPSCD